MGTEGGVAPWASGGRVSPARSGSGVLRTGSGNGPFRCGDSGQEAGGRPGEEEASLWAVGHGRPRLPRGSAGMAPSPPAARPGPRRARAGLPGPSEPGAGAREAIRSHFPGVLQRPGQGRVCAPRTSGFSLPPSSLQTRQSGGDRGLRAGTPAAGAGGSPGRGVCVGVSQPAATQPQVAGSLVPTGPPGLGLPVSSSL